MPVSRIREVMELAWKDPEAIHLEVGEPDFPTPEHVVDAAHEAAREGHTRYAPNAGLPELREALADKRTRRRGIVAGPRLAKLSHDRPPARGTGGLVPT
jgi:aspartate aminotransferase